MDVWTQFSIHNLYPALANILLLLLLLLLLFFFLLLFIIWPSRMGKKIVGMPFLPFSSVTVGRQFVDLTIVWMESSQNKHMLQTVDESYFLMNSVIFQY